jgi:hypothetical protein
MSLESDMAVGTMNWNHCGNPDRKTTMKKEKREVEI